MIGPRVDSATSRAQGGWTSHLSTRRRWGARELADASDSLRHMRPQLQAIAGSQGGVFFRRQAMASGYSDMEIRELKRSREWLAVRRGAYVEAEVAPPGGDVEAWHRLRTLAVLHHVHVPSVASHTSAVGLLRLPHWGTDLSHVYLTRSRRHAGRIEAGVSHHEADLPDWQTTTVAGVRCTTGARTAWDIAREFGFEAGVVVSDAVLRVGRQNERRGHVSTRTGPQVAATHDDLDRLSRLMGDWPNSRAATAAFAFADAGAETVGESLARMFVVSLGFPAPRTQVVIEGDGLVARVDMLVDALGWVIEFDGRQKYRRARDDCDPVVDDGDIVWAEKLREDALRGLGKHVSRLVWADLFGSRRRQAGAALWRTAERIGAPQEWTRPDWFRAA